MAQDQLLWAPTGEEPIPVIRHFLNDVFFYRKVGRCMVEDLMEV